MDTARKKKKNRRWLLLALLVLCALAGGWYYFHAKKTKENAPQKTIITIEIGDLEETVTAQGKLEPKEYVDVGAQVSGQLDRIHVEIGDTVQAGDLLAEIDPEVYVSRVQASEARLKTLDAQVAQQDAEVKLARQKFERNRKLIESKAISQELFEQAETEYKVAQAQRAALHAQREEAQSTLEGDRANLGYTSIFAPMAGTVVLQPSREGQTINASQSAPTIVLLANLDIMTVRAQVAEADVTRIVPGMEVYFTTLGSGERRWTGVVRQVLPSPEIVNDVVLYNVLVDVDNKDRQLMTGMSTQMFFVLGRASMVPVIPVSALGKRTAKNDSATGQAYMVRAAEGRREIDKIIHIGLMDRAVAEIKAGLKAGDKVLVETPPLNAGSGQRQGGPGFRGGPRL